MHAHEGLCQNELCKTVASQYLFGHCRITNANISVVVRVPAHKHERGKCMHDLIGLVKLMLAANSNAAAVVRTTCVHM